MAEYILWIEGVNFDAHILDTQNLSTLRGASLAYLRSSDRAKEILLKKFKSNVEQIISGASLAVFKIKLNDGEGAENVKCVGEKILEEFAAEGANPKHIKKAVKSGAWPEKIPLAHLSFVFGVATIDGDEGKALQQAQANARLKQHRQMTLRPLGPGTENAKEPCAIDKRRPAIIEAHLPDEKKGLASTSSAARRFFGQKARQAFYALEIGADVAAIEKCDGFVDEFQNPLEIRWRSFMPTVTVSVGFAVRRLTSKRISPEI